MLTIPDETYDNPRLAAIYDPLDPDRSDLEVYLAIALELGARSVLDLGCGTGTFALMLADAGLDVIGVDPARASVEVARGKPGADRVHWIDGDATAIPDVTVDLVTMTANAAQAIVDPAEWTTTLERVHAVLRDGGHFVFETRDPARRAWEEWTREPTYAVTDIDGVGEVETWHDLLRVDLPLVTFRSNNVFRSDGATLVSESTLRFRERDEVTGQLEAAGFSVADVRDAPDRPGREFVFFAQRRG